MASAYAPERSAPAPLYLLESDSEDEAWDELNRVARPSLRRPVPDDPVVRFEGSVPKRRRVVLMIGEAGERVLKRARCEQTAFIKLKVVDDDDDEQVVGSVHTSQSSSDVLVFVDPVVPLHAMHPFARSILSQLEPEQLDILSTYHLPSYISSSPSDEPLIRSLHRDATIDSKSSAPYESPNLIHGLPAAFFASTATTSTSRATLHLLPSFSIPTLSGTRKAPSGMSATYYDAGGPTDLNQGPDAWFSSHVGPHFSRLAAEKGWDAWWDGSSADARQKAGSSPLAWLEKERRRKRNEDLGTMYM